MKENNPFYAQYNNDNDWKRLTFTIFNYLDEEGFITTISSLYKKKYSIDDFIMKVIPLTQDDILSLKDKNSILSLCLQKCIKYISDEQKEFLYPKAKCFKFGNLIVYIKTIN